MLGLDQLRRFKCIIDLEQNVLVFGGAGGVQVPFREHVRRYIQRTPSTAAADLVATVDLFVYAGGDLFLRGGSNTTTRRNGTPSISATSFLLRVAARRRRRRPRRGSRGSTLGDERREPRLDAVRPSCLRDANQHGARRPGTPIQRRELRRPGPPPRPARVEADHVRDRASFHKCLGRLQCRLDAVEAELVAVPGHERRRRRGGPCGGRHVAERQERRRRRQRRGERALERRRRAGHDGRDARLDPGVRRLAATAPALGARGRRCLARPARRGRRAAARPRGRRPPPPPRRSAAAAP